MSQVQFEGKVLKENDRIAAELRNEFLRHEISCINIISAPGSGKTALLERTLQRITNRERVAVLTGDIQTENDANRLKRFGSLVRQITTGGTCHLDASMVRRHLEPWDLSSIDLLLIENVGNLVCPSSYDLGEEAKVVLLSVTEGEDKPLKYPSIFFKSQAMLITKTDLLPYVPFDIGRAEENARSIHPGIEILRTSCLKETGIQPWLDWLEQRRKPSHSLEPVIQR